MLLCGVDLIQASSKSQCYKVTACSCREQLFDWLPAYQIPSNEDKVAQLKKKRNLGQEADVQTDTKRLFNVYSLCLSHRGA